MKCGSNVKHSVFPARVIFEVSRLGKKTKPSSDEEGFVSAIITDSPGVQHVRKPVKKVSD